MNNNLKKRLYPKNPLGIIALFVFFIEAISTISIKFLLDNQSPYTKHIVWFIILFPSIIALLFFVTLWWKRESFYSPGDFREDSSFVGLIKKVRTLEIKQEASQLDPAADDEVFIKTIGELIKTNEIQTAIQVGRSSLKERRYENSYKIFSYLEKNISKSNDLYTRILANLGYSLIGLKKFKEAINNLLEVKKLREEKRFYVWHALALAYSYFQIGEKENYKKWLEYASKRKEYQANLQFVINLYPEIKKDLLNI